MKQRGAKELRLQVISCGELLVKRGTRHKKMAEALWEYMKDLWETDKDLE